MDLNRMKDEDKLVLSRKYFYGGFALLPFLWFVNAIWFFREAFLRKPIFDQQKAIKGYVIKSIVSGIVDVIVVVECLCYLKVSGTFKNCVLTSLVEEWRCHPLYQRRDREEEWHLPWPLMSVAQVSREPKSQFYCQLRQCCILCFSS